MQIEGPLQPALRSKYPVAHQEFHPNSDQPFYRPSCAPQDNTRSHSFPPRPTLKKRHITQLQQYPWPGNIRELQNIMERAVITAQNNTITLELPTPNPTQKTSQQSPTQNDNPILTNPQFLQFEKQNIRNALQQTNWKVAGKEGAAQLLQAKPTTLASRIKRLNIQK